LLDELSEVGEEIADRFLTGIEEVVGRSLIDSAGHLAAQILEGALEGLWERIDG